MSDDIISVINNYNNITNTYYEVKELLSKKECFIIVDDIYIQLLQTKLKAYYHFIPYDLSIINQYPSYKYLKNLLIIYYNKLPRYFIN